MDDLLGGCAFNSFKAGTLVMTDEGAVPIEEIREGSMVLAYDEATGEIGYYPVTDLISHVDIQVVYLTIAGETLVTTADHPFYTSGYEWMEAGDLQIGDDIRTAAWTTGTVEAIYIVTQPQRMYNFTVATAHTYFIGDEQWLVHNSGGCIKITPNWKAYDFGDKACKNGCELVADQIHNLIGGDIKTIVPIDAPVLGGIGKNNQWFNSDWGHHVVVVKDGRVYDAFTGSGGLSINDYKDLWRYKDEIDFGF